jgi:hypothetical protein
MVTVWSPLNDEIRKAHWENVYCTKGENEVSWFQESPAPSLELTELAKPTPDAAIVDNGGGASRLVDMLLRRGFRDVTVLDLSEAALAAAKVRLGDKAARCSGSRRMLPNGLHRRVLISGMTGRHFIFLPIPLIAPPTLLASLKQSSRAAPSS